MKWTKFKDELPPSVTLLFVTNYVLVWPFYQKNGSWEEYAKSWPDCAWARIELPKVPKKELHLCTKYNHEDIKIGTCSEENNELILRIGKYNPAIVTNVSFCPYCGYSIKDQTS